MFLILDNDDIGGDVDLDKSDLRIHLNHSRKKIFFWRVLVLFNSQFDTSL